ncbi:MAG TPA: cupin domain-containing protein, partial [Candidatus Blautia stercoravium]|nr:cupin domain-containing protein [Candidatus Blautia stercoravium]
MKYIELIERRQHGSFDFPFAFYDVNHSHSRYNMQLHWHKEFEILHVISGKFFLSIDNTHYTLSEGDTAIISGGSLHGGMPAECNYQCLVFDLEFFIKNHCFGADELQTILLHEQNMKPFFPSADDFVKCCCENLMSAIQKRDPGWQLSSIGFMCSLLGYILQQKYLVSTSSFTLKNKKKIKQFKTVLSFISEHYTEKLTLAQL